MNMSSSSTINITLLDQPSIANFTSFFSPSPHHCKSSTSPTISSNVSNPDPNPSAMFSKRKSKQQASCTQSSKDAVTKGKKQKKINVGEGDKKENEETPTGYVHVRAKRGQATDSHSLAERMRRERISVRMKLLQELVPGCDKVTGKAVMLDEIINYVQSLQNQVEFLSMKLASVNPMYDFSMDLNCFMVNQEQNFRSLEGSPILSGMQESPNGCYSHFLHDSPTSVLLLQQNPNLDTRPNGEYMWELDDQRQKYPQTGNPNPDALFSFH